MYKSLQTGRAIAAILVVLYHLGLTISKEKYFGINEFSIPFSFGGAGVDFFFVLSGFIIFNAHRKDIFKHHMLVSYIKKRLIRIYPIYWIIFLAVFFLALTSNATKNSVPHDVVVILKSLFLLPQSTHLVGGTGAPVILVAWTLQYEMLFYLLFAILISGRLTALIIFIALVYVIRNYTENPSIQLLLGFLSDNYMFLFLMGIIVAYISAKITVVRPMFYTSIGSMMLIFISLDLVTHLNLLAAWRVIFYGVASSLIIFGLVQGENKGKTIGAQGWIQMLGNSSYALYLIHFPLISFLCKLSVHVELNRLGLIGAMITYIVIFLICLISAVSFHLWIERPLTNYINKFSISKFLDSISLKKSTRVAE